MGWVLVFGKRGVHRPREVTCGGTDIKNLYDAPNIKVMQKRNSFFCKYVVDIIYWLGGRFQPLFEDEDT